MQRERINTIRSLSAVNIIAGLYLLISPAFVHYATTQATWTSVILGIVAIVFGVTREVMVDQVWPSWINVADGVLLILAPFVLSMSSSAAYWNLIVVGAVLVVFGFVNGSIRGPTMTSRA